MALHEQIRDPRGFLFTEVAEREELLRSLESLSGSSEVATHADLLWWTIQVLLEIMYHERNTRLCWSVLLPPAISYVCD